MILWLLCIVGVVLFFLYLLPNRSFSLSRPNIGSALPIEITFNGTPEQIGGQIAKYYYHMGLNGYDNKIDVMKITQNAYKTYLPEKYVIYDTISRILNVPLTNFLANSKMPVSCSIYGKKINDSLVIGRTMDSDPRDKNNIHIYKIKMNDNAKGMFISDMNFYNTIAFIPSDGIKDGLYIGITSIDKPNFTYLGVSPHDMLEHMILHCSSVEGCIEELKKIPLQWSVKYFIADEKKMCIIEHKSKTAFEVIYPEKDSLICTNHCEKMFFCFGSKWSQKRYEIIKDMLNKANTYEDFWNINKNISVDKYNYLTLWNLVLDMTNKKYWIKTSNGYLKEI